LSVFDDESANELADTQNTSIGLHPILQQFSYVEHYLSTSLSSVVLCVWQMVKYA